MSAWIKIAFAGVAVPLFIYNVAVAEFHKTDNKYGRKRREFMGYD